MQKILLKVKFLLLVVPFFFAANVYAKTLRTSSVQNEAVVTVMVNDREDRPILSETGLVVHKDGIVAVSCNAISRWYDAMHNTLVIRTESGRQFFTEELLSKNCRNNVALITVKATGLTAAKLASGYKPKEGEEISVAGILHGEGRIKSVRESDGLMRITVPIQESGNGSPVFNRKGEVIGIATYLQRDGRTVNFVLPVRSVSKELDRYNSLVRKLLESTEVETSRPAPPAVQKPEKKTDKVAAIPEAQLLPEKAKPKKEGAYAYFLQAGFYEKQQKYNDAIDAYRTAISIDPQYADAYVNLGLAYYKTGKYTEAVTAYRRAIGLKRDSLQVYSKLGAAYIIIGEYSKAVDTFKRAAAIGPSDPEIHFQLGVTFLLAGNKDGAIGEYTALKKIDRERADALLDLIY